MKDLTTISTDIFNKVRSRFSKIKLGNQNGEVIADGNPAAARFFELNYTVEGNDLGPVTIKVDNKKLTIIYNESMTDGDNSKYKQEWYSFLKEMRMFAMSNMLEFDTRDITKSNLDQRDFKYLANENGDTNMSESKLFGTSKTSYQDMGEARIIVKHSQPVNYNIPGGRTMHIDSIYIESSSGERFRYPHKHLNGARAMAMHIAHGGNSYDQIGTHISSLSEELSKLRQFKNYTQRNGLSEALNDVAEKVLTRIDTIKEQISKLQRSSYYETFKEQFQPAQDMPIPEETINNWVDALTIRTFNEELKNVFPFIYRLVDQPRELAYEDLVGEGEIDRQHGDIEPWAYWSFPERVAKKLYQMHKGQPIDKSAIVQLWKTDGPDRMTKFMLKPDVSAILSYYQQMGEQDPMFAEFADRIASIGAMEYEQEAAHMEPQDIEDEPADEEETQEQMDPRVMSQAIVEFVKSMYNAEDGTFPRGEEGVKIAVEKRFGDNAGQFAARVIEALKPGM